MGFIESVYSNDLKTMSTSSVSSNGYPVQAGETILYGYNLVNTAAATRYVKLYNVSAAANVGTDTPFYRTAIAAGDSQQFFPKNGIKFNTGMNVVATSTAGDTSSGAVTAGDVFGFFLYN